MLINSSSPFYAVAHWNWSCEPKANAKNIQSTAIGAAQPKAIDELLLVGNFPNGMFKAEEISQLNYRKIE
jgi:hypothetical protein